MEAYSGLVAAICCIGACYSDRVEFSLVREITSCLYATLERDCNLDPNNMSQPPFTIKRGEDKIGLEKLQALVLTDSLMVWNGTSDQRATAQRTFPTINLVVRSSGLLRIENDSTMTSYLHQPTLDLQSLSSHSFDWRAWVEQEKRNRTMHLVHLNDVARGLYFNLDPLFDALEIHIPLPADDAAWEAQCSEECAQALNLAGLDAVRKTNPDGSQRSKQPELHLALCALLHPSLQIQPGSTNLYGKFILIHAILAQIRRDQMGGDLAIPDVSLSSLRQMDWAMVNEFNDSKTTAALTPEAPLITPQSLKNFGAALEKWKNYWDMDMAIQFPPTVSSPRRHGFCRDGPHFYWLATIFLQHPKANSSLHTPNQRFALTFELLKRVTAWVETDGARRGEEIGSVSDIGHEHISPHLTLDMAQIFKPLPPDVHSLTGSRAGTEA